MSAPEQFLREPRPVADLVAAMHRWQGPGDPEIAHMEADDLLVEMVRTLSRDRPAAEVHQIQGFLTDFLTLLKWYS